MNDQNDDERTRVRERAADDERETAEEERERSTEELVCPECGGRLEVDEERGEVVCSECGLVVEEDEIDRGPEWRAFDAAESEEKSRVGAPLTKMMHDEGLSTTIGWQDRDSAGQLLSAKQRQKMQRLRTWNERFRTRDSKERNLKQALGEIDRMASGLGLSKSVRETASVIYRRALDEELLPGRSIEGVATACLYAAARKAGMPRSLDEVATVSRVDRDEIARTYRYVVRELELEVEPVDPIQYVPRIASELDRSEHVERRARELLEAAHETGQTSGKSPVGLAAAAVYAAAILEDERVTQSQVGDVANVSEVTIRNRYHELLDIWSEKNESVEGQ
ncbi:transcription initiation factor IIB [Halanaeroarchaeum sulfurireducens]|uniref:Transcription initiation factor IIB n=1 Tax=Halanaeroarchaeum sulfurireducens TaxID=1604004 RepID=A0A0F7PEQ2_9EURY|nr:transcription initiation factor IIB [Halanaeroarchaeum sulfurireducens]AKH97803.1 transcription initiation factor IIB 2 [Halanaeroarchaeum sulfurireducens]ALG82197.1 transcription initiation factor IIB 2 [Halanaeroarchaeum sulfurireducens]